MPDPQPVPGTHANLVAERRSIRVSNSETRAQAAEKLKLEGNARYVKGDWVGAADLYAQAINIHGPKPVLLANMAAAYLKLELYDEAEWATTTALEYDPSYVKARYRRAMARKGLTRYKSAKSDLKYMLKQEPKNEEAKKELQDIEARMKNQPGLPEEPGEKLPHPDDLPWTLLSDSETEDCKHTGNTFDLTACRFYNHSKCTKGAECNFSHAPDAKSVRDEIGKNVCLHFLIGDCEFGGQCLYSHSRKYLPPQSWWDDPAQLHAASMTLPYVDDYTDHRELHDLLLKYPSARTYASHQLREAVLFHLKRQLSEAKAKIEKRQTSKTTATPSTATTAPVPTTTQAPQTREKFVLVLSFDWQDAFAEMHSHLISGLEKKIAAVHIRSFQQMSEALECLESPSLTSVLVMDVGITKREYAKVLQKLVAYVKNGGSVTFGGAFVSFIRPTDFTKFMKTTWDLNWEIGSYFRSQFSVNQSNEIVKKNPSLVKSYSMKCSHIAGIKPEMAVYHQTDESYTQSHVFAPEKTSKISSGEAPAVSVSLGKGRLSILGDVNEEQESTNTVLAMLGVLDMPKEPQAKSSSSPLQTQTKQAESSKSAQSATKTEVPALVKEDSNKITDKFVLVLELEGDTHVAQKFSRQLSELSKRIVVKTLYEFDVREALSLLTSPDLHGVYLMDEGTQNIQNLNFRIALGPYVRSGGLVVFGGMFGPNIEHDTINHIFATFGLRWILGSTRRCEAQLNRHHETAVRYPTLSEAFNLQAVNLQGFQPEHLFYEQHIDEDETHRGSRLPRGGLLEAPILRAHVGKGHVGYIGDIGPEPESTDVLLSMFELLTPPRTLEPYSQKFLIMLTGFEEPLLKTLVPDFMKDLRGKVEVVMGLSGTGLSHARIVDLLSSKDLIGVLVGDTHVLQPENAYLLSKLVEYSKNGGTLVFGWQFSKGVSTVQFRPLFRDNWGLNWEMEGNFECGVKRNFHNPLFKDKEPEELTLPKKTRIEGIHVKGIAKEMAVYFALTQKKLWNPDKNIFMSAVVFAEVEKGRLGYIGSANLDGEGRDIIYTMFGLV